MTREQLAMRILSSEANIDSHRLRLGLYTHQEEARIIDAIGMLSDLPVFIDDTPYQGMVEMRGKARRLALERGLDLLVVDYLQLVQGKQKWGQSNRVQEITEISRELKGLAGDLKVALIACSQLNRMVENRPNNRPRLSDLRDSGSIEQDADVVMFIHRGGRLRHRGGVESGTPGPGVPQEHCRDHHCEAPEGSNRKRPPGVHRQPGEVRLNLIRAFAPHQEGRRLVTGGLFLCRAPGSPYRSSLRRDHHRSSSKKNISLITTTTIVGPLKCAMDSCRQGRRHAGSP